MTISSSQEKSPMIGQSFEEKLQAIKRSAEEKKRLDQQKMYGPIDYDDVETTKESKAVSFPVKIGIGIAVVVFGLIFAFGDILPSGPTNVQKAGTASQQERDLKDSSQLKEQLQRFLTILKDNPDNLDALEGVAVSYAEIGEFAKAEPTLLQLVEKKPMDVEALRLLGEVQNALGKFSECVNSYRKALKISPRSITLWKGLSEGLVSQGNPELAIKEIISERDRLRTSKQENVDNKEQISDPDEATWIQINLLLGKLYAEWDHTTDALAVYDSIIKSNPDDFQGYLAKGILLKKQEQKGEAERMFIQAKFLAPENLKSLVDRYSKQ
ncbi:hypothetical protein KP509_16G081000 [Ceratopteris richardii]|uniref:Tetratricopeptide repeat protein n=1 Tax=Ceratopteris richardii TaxID=49495 RepID=A0A8T2T3N6_CERRI|nr:hypothetical protein KP509_16G081000 [Ceratopteris richardii]KAH7388543.1 hypothetical protein KP509_16G081000 [Ceratopteris richardii]